MSESFEYVGPGMPAHQDFSNNPDFIEGGYEMCGPSATSSAGFTVR